MIELKKKNELTFSFPEVFPGAELTIEFQPEGVPIELGRRMAVAGFKTDDDPELGIALHDRSR